MNRSLTIWSPRPDAKDVVRLSDNVVIYPLPVMTIETLPLETEKKLWLEQADSCLFVSHNAVSQLLKQISPKLLQQKTHIAIGERTAKTLRSYQLVVAAVAKPPFTSESLLNTVEFSALNIEQVALCCGTGGRTVIQAGLTACGKKVERIECYQRNKAKLPRQVMVEFTNGHQINAVIMSSCRIADAVVANLSRACIDFRQWVAFTFSERIAMYVRSLGFSRVVVVPISNQQSLNQAIIEWWEIKGKVK